MSLTTRRASAADRDFLLNLHHAAYHDVVVAQFGAWNESDQAKRFAEKWKQSQYDVVQLDGIDVGALWTSRTDHDLFLNEIQVLPEYQGRGIGTALIEGVVARARSLGLPLRLRVLKANRARALYDRLGFTEEGQTDTHFLLRFDP